MCSSLFRQYFCYFVNTSRTPPCVYGYPVVIPPKLNLCGCLNHFWANIGCLNNERVGTSIGMRVLLAVLCYQMLPRTALSLLE